jgi:hypothetical protein
LLLGYNEAKYLLENIEKANSGSDVETASILVLKTAKDFGPTNVVILSNLTGLEFNSIQDLYNYFRKTLVLDKETIAELAISQLAISLFKEKGSKEGLLDELKNMLS